MLRPALFLFCEIAVKSRRVGRNKIFCGKNKKFHAVASVGIGKTAFNQRHIFIGDGEQPPAGTIFCKHAHRVNSLHIIPHPDAVVPVLQRNLL